MCLLVNIPKVGYGNSVKKILENPECANQITGFNVELIKRFNVILQVILSGYGVNPTKLDYARITAQKNVELYAWHLKPPTFHKVPMHGTLAISEAMHPIGQLSEKAAEQR